MRTSDIARPITAKSLNENLFKQFNVKINFDKYTREQLEDARNKYRSKLFAQEAQANFNDLLNNESYQRDKYVLDVLNTRIKEMLGENIARLERQIGEAKLPMKTVKGKKVKEGAKADKNADKEKDRVEVGEDMEPEDLGTVAEINRLIAKGMHETDAIHAVAKKYGDNPSELASFYYQHNMHEGKKIDQNKDGNKKETMKKAVGDKKKNPFGNKKVKEGAKPDFLDMDKDGDKKEPMKKAVKDKKVKETQDDRPSSSVTTRTVKVKGQDGKDIEQKRHSVTGWRSKQQSSAAEKARKADKDVYESRNVIAESIAYYIAEDEEGKAKSITAAADMVNDFTSWMQRVGNYQTKSMIELADNIRANFGMQEAETFKQSVGSALEGALTSLTQAREEINNAVAVLAGEAPAEEPMGMDSDVGDTGADMNLDMDQTAPDDMNAGGDEFAASDAAAGGPETTGRMKRESIERGNRLMKILGA